MILGYKYFVPGTKYFVPGTPFPGKGHKYLAECVQYFIPGHFYSFIVLDISFIVINISSIVINISFQVDNISFRESVSSPTWIRKPKFINKIQAHAQKGGMGTTFSNHSAKAVRQVLRRKTYWIAVPPVKSRTPAAQFAYAVASAH